MPDFWDSSKVKRAAVPRELEPPLKPKVITVAGEATHHGGGPSHNLYAPSSSSSSTSTPPKVPKSALGQLAASWAHDLSLPTTFKVPTVSMSEYDIAQKTETSGGQGRTYSRTLDQDEKTGVWVILGLFASSWIAAGYFAPVSEWAHKAEAKVQDIEDKSAAKKH